MFVSLCIALLVPPFFLALLPQIARWLATALRSADVRPRMIRYAPRGVQQIHLHDEDAESRESLNEIWSIGPEESELELVAFSEDSASDSSRDIDDDNREDDDIIDDAEYYDSVDEPEDEVGDEGDEDDMYYDSVDEGVVHPAVEAPNPIKDEREDLSSGRECQDEQEVDENASPEAEVPLPADEPALTPLICRQSPVTSLESSERSAIELSDNAEQNPHESDTTSNTTLATSSEALDKSLTSNAVEVPVPLATAQPELVQEPTFDTIEPVVAIPLPHEVPPIVVEEQLSLPPVVPVFHREPIPEEIAEILSRTQALSASLGRAITEDECLVGLSQLMAHNDATRKHSYAGYPLDESIVVNLTRHCRNATHEELQAIRSQAHDHYKLTGVVPTDEQWATGLLLLMSRRDVLTRLAQTNTVPIGENTSVSPNQQLREYLNLHRDPTEEEIMIVKVESESLGRPTTVLECRQALLTLMSRNDEQALQLQPQAQNDPRVTQHGLVTQVSGNWAAQSIAQSGVANYATANAPCSTVASYTDDRVSTVFGLRFCPDFVPSSRRRDMDVDPITVVSDSTPTPKPTGNMASNGAQEPRKTEREIVMETEMEMEDVTLVMIEPSGQGKHTELQAGQDHSTSSQKKQDKRVRRTPELEHAPASESRERTRDPQHRSSSRTTPPPEAYDSRGPHYRDDVPYYSYSPRDHGRSPGQERYHHNERFYDCGGDRHRQPMYPNRDMEGSASFYPRPPDHHSGMSPGRMDRHCRGYEERHSVREEREREDQMDERGGHSRDCTCSDCGDIFGNGSDLSPYEESISSADQHMEMSDRYEHGPSSRHEHDDWYDDRRDQQHRVHNDSRYGGRYDERRNEHYEERESDGDDSEVVIVELTEEQQEYANSLMDDLCEFKAARKPVPRGLIKELEGMGYIFDD